MTTQVTASLVVSFDAANAAASDGLVLEIDDRAAADGGLNQGNTSFAPGDAAYYLLYKTDAITIKTHLVTPGSRSSAGSGSREIEEVLTFTDSKESSLSHPAHSAVTMTWEGMTRTDGGSAAVTKQVVDQRTVKLSAAVAGFLRCVYTSNFDAFKLHNVPTNLTQAMVYVIGERPD